jgi:hypothetical protein
MTVLFPHYHFHTVSSLTCVGPYICPICLCNLLAVCDSP